MAALFHTQLCTPATHAALTPALTSGPAAAIVKVNAGTTHALAGGSSG